MNLGHRKIFFHIPLVPRGVGGRIIGVPRTRYRTRARVSARACSFELEYVRRYLLARGEVYSELYAGNYLAFRGCSGVPKGVTLGAQAVFLQRKNVGRS